MNKTPLPILSASAPDQCADYLRRVILNGEFKSGESIILDQVARSLGVSHTPIREAIRRLEAEGFVEYFPRRGAVVRPTLLADFEQLVEIRQAIEPVLLAAAIGNFMGKKKNQLLASFKHWEHQTDPTEILAAQWDFYSTMYTFAEKPLILAAARSNWQHIFRYHRISWDERARARRKDIELMGVLKKQFLAGDEEKSQEALNATIVWGYEIVRDHLLEG